MSAKYALQFVYSLIYSIFFFSCKTELSWTALHQTYHHELPQSTKQIAPDLRDLDSSGELDPVRATLLRRGGLLKPGSTRELDASLVGQALQKPTVRCYRGQWRVCTRTCVQLARRERRRFPVSACGVDTAVRPVWERAAQRSQPPDRKRPLPSATASRQGFAQFDPFGPAGAPCGRLWHERERHKSGGPEVLWKKLFPCTSMGVAAGLPRGVRQSGCLQGVGRSSCHQRVGLSGVTREWDCPGVSREWDCPGVTREWVGPDVTREWDGSGVTREWDGPGVSREWDGPGVSREWDGPGVTREWESPGVTREWDSPGVVPQVRPDVKRLSAGAYLPSD
ncbi:uncharacterized protein LOC119101287 [Pollicipes pollicipes]|uniref:uncharacterized protein LOC119101287 n=1 Tax=Pollicipes pollicipes TaxID=41117 RepID=UPI001884FE53|nr:uncharacterized protein LOC119101287 [Pollicipes pollicipes]